MRRGERGKYDSIGAAWRWLPITWLHTPIRRYGPNGLALRLDAGACMMMPCSVALMPTLFMPTLHNTGKLRRVLDLCAELGVAAAPACIAGVWIVPLLSWYHATWDREPDIPGALPVTKVVPSTPGLVAPCF